MTKEQALAVRKPDPAPVVASSWEQMTDIMRAMYPGASDATLAVFFYQAKKMGLDPLARQIHLVPRDGKFVMQCGIDGYRTVADRTGLYAGSEEAFDGGASQFDLIAKGVKRPTTATVTVFKIVAGVRCPFTATAAWSAYAPSGKAAFMWEKMPFLMLGKCAEALALRKAFPQDLSGVYTDEEMHQAGPIVDAPKPAVPIKAVSALAVEAHLVKDESEDVTLPAPVVDEPMPAVDEIARATVEQQAEVRDLAKALGMTVANAKAAAGVPSGKLNTDEAVKLIGYLKALAAPVVA